MFITRFSAVERGGLLLPEGVKADDRDALLYTLARSGIRPAVMPANEIIDITPPYSVRARNMYLVATGPAVGPNGEPDRAVLDVMPRNDDTINIEMGGEHLRKDKMDTPGEGVSYRIPEQVGGFPLTSVSKSGINVYEMITVVSPEHIEVLGRIAAFAQEGR